MERSGTGLEEEGKHGQENTHAIKQAAASDNRGKDVGRTGGTVNESHTVQEDCTKDRTRNEVLESTFVGIHVLAAKAHQGVNREASQFHTQEKGEEVDSLGHERCAASCKQQESVSFATLELFVTEGPLESCNPEESAEHHGKTQHATDRVHSVQVHKDIVSGKVVSTCTKSNKQGSYPWQNLVLVFVFDERFCGKGHQRAQSHKDYRQEIYVITHFQKPPSHWPRFVQARLLPELRQLQIRSCSSAGQSEKRVLRR